MDLTFYGSILLKYINFYSKPCNENCKNAEWEKNSLQTERLEMYLEKTIRFSIDSF